MTKATQALHLALIRMLKGVADAWETWVRAQSVE